jgi:DNA-binding transcriptional regulator GbsR (MarR family)
MKRKAMPEKEYRASSLCRVLGNPTAYQIMKLLLSDFKKLSPTEISKKLGLSIVNTSKTLKNLRQVDLVRYETERNEKKYYIKDKKVKKIFEALEFYIETTKEKKY